MIHNYTISKQYHKKFISLNDEECVKIPKKYKHIIKINNSKDYVLRLKDSIHSHKNLRKTSYDWKYFNQNIENN